MVEEPKDVSALLKDVSALLKDVSALLQELEQLRNVESRCAVQILRAERERDDALRQLAKESSNQVDLGLTELEFSKIEDPGLRLFISDFLLKRMPLVVVVDAPVPTFDRELRQVHWTAEHRAEADRLTKVVGMELSNMGLESGPAECNNAVTTKATAAEIVKILRIEQVERVELGG